MIDTALVLNEKESINLVTGYSQTTGDDCVGTFRMKTCSLHSAIGEYDVTVDHDIVTLASEPPRIVAISNNTEVNHSVTDGWHPSTLSGVVSTLLHLAVEIHRTHSNDLVQSRSKADGRPTSPDSRGVLEIRWYGDGLWNRRYVLLLSTVSC